MRQPLPYSTVISPCLKGNIVDSDRYDMGHYAA